MVKINRDVGGSIPLACTSTYKPCGERNNMKNRKSNEACLSVGDTIRHPIHKWGVVKQVDTRFKPNFEFFYLVDFRGRGGDGTLAWIAKSDAERMKRERRTQRPRRTMSQVVSGA